LSYIYTEQVETSGTTTYYLGSQRAQTRRWYIIYIVVDSW